MIHIAAISATGEGAEASLVPHGSRALGSISDLLFQSVSMRRSHVDMLHRGAARKVLPAGIVVGVLALALMLPAGAAASAFLAGYGYSYGGNLHSGPSVNPPSGSTTTIFVAGGGGLAFGRTDTNACV